MPTSALRDFIDSHARLFVLTGAGCSTASGIPDYRDADGAWKRGLPIMLQDFLAHERARKRYWARGLIGWRRMRAAQPNDAHRALAELIERNPEFRSYDAAAAPDGDAALEGVDFEAFTVPACEGCGGLLKPDVVFFGERVPPERVQQAFAALEVADAVLVVGSSLMVYSGYRFAEAAARAGKPIAAVNLGRTRADGLLALKVEQRCADALAFLLAPSGRERGARVYI